MTTPEPAKRKRAPRPPRPKFSYYCGACTVEAQTDKRKRYCGFHGGLRTFQSQNYGCATLSRLRWLLQQQGVRLNHPEQETGLVSLSMGVKDVTGKSLGRLFASWIRGTPRLAVMMLIKDEECFPLSLDTAEAILDAHKLANESEVRLRSNGFMA